MIGRMIKRALVVSLLVFGLAIISHAQTSQQPYTQPSPQASPQQEEIPPQKRALIREYLEVTHVRKTADDILDAALSQAANDLPELLSEMLKSDSTLTAAEREQALQKVNEVTTRIMRRYAEGIRQINFAQIMEDFTASIANKYFTEDELRDLIAFYRTPTGQKSISVLPRIFAESSSQLRQAIGPQVEHLMSDIVRDELKRLQDDLEWQRSAQRPNRPASSPRTRRRP